jgi:hypothetical protein
VGELGYEKLVVAVLLVVLYAVSGELPAWSVAGVVTALLVALCIAETIPHRRRAGRVVRRS